MAENESNETKTTGNETKTSPTNFAPGLGPTGLYESLFMYSVNQFAADYFSHHLWSGIGSGLSKLAGISKIALQEYGVGYAPESGGEFCDLLQKHCSGDMCMRCGLLSWKADGTYLSKFRDRLMFPIRDDRDRIVAFSGMSLSDPYEARGPRFLETGACTAVYSPNNPPATLKNIAMRVLQLQVLTNYLEYDDCLAYDDRLAGTTPMRALVEMVKRLGME